jgi:type IV pilus assembly protein PilQ
LNKGGHKEISRCMIGILIGALSIVGCASDTTLKKDSTFDKWSAMAETQIGQSPSPRERSISETEEGLQSIEEAGGKLTASPIKELPTQIVSLKMNQADVKAVLRALARIVDKNILVKGDIKGEITVDLRDIPWNEAFNGILRNQGLSYAWEGDVLRVVSLADIEAELRRKKTISAAIEEEQKQKESEPLLTAVIRIDYAIEDEFGSSGTTTGATTGTTTGATPGATTGVTPGATTGVRGRILKETLESFLTPGKDGKPRGSIRVDSHSSSLIISAIKEDLRKIRAIIEKIDKPLPQIQIRANIVEATKNTARDLGIQWGGMYAQRVGTQSMYITPGGTIGSTTGGATSTVTTPSPLSGAYSPTASGPQGIAGQGFGVNFPATTMTATGAASLGLIFGTIGGNLLELQLNALQTEGKLNILSTPSITTRDNRTAFTENGKRVPVNTQTLSAGTVSNTVTYIDAVLRLEITPHVIDGRFLTMRIVVMKNEVDPVRNVAGNPFIIKKETRTSLIVEDGETIVISGLTKQSGTTSVSGVPWLKEIPVLGWLFKGEGKTETMEEVLIFITPRILPTKISPQTSSRERPTKKENEDGG